MKQQQFLNLASAEVAEERFWQAVQPGPLQGARSLYSNE